MPVIKETDNSAETLRPGLQRRLAYEGQLMVAVLDFSDGPWEKAEQPHFHPHVQVSYVADGEVIFYCEDEPDQHLKAGDIFQVPSGKKHSIKLLSPTARLVDAFNPLREDFLRKP